MKRIITIVSLLLLSIYCSAGTYSPQDLDLTKIKSNHTRVINPDKIIGQDYSDSIDNVLLSLDSLGVQCVVAVCEHFKGNDPYEFAIGLGRHLGVGNKNDQGVVVALATKDRSYWISTGEGMEKFLPDIICRDIEELYMLPHLKQEEWGKALLTTSRGIHGYLFKNSAYVNELQSYEESKSSGSGWTALGVILGIFGLIRYAIYRQKKKESLCPYCNQYKLELTKREKTIISDDEVRYKSTYICQNCHQTTYKDIIRIISSSSPGSVAGGVIGGSLGRHSGGSGGRGPFSGLGGGRFGGGGAGGRF